MNPSVSTAMPEIEPIDGVYVPTHDSRLLIEAYLECADPIGLEVLDLCCGSGVVGIAAAMRGSRVESVDADRRAVVASRRNALLNGIELAVRHGDLFDAVDGRRYDVILSNPPYVPTPPTGAFHRFKWSDGGEDGRALVDRICTGAADHLSPGGQLLMVHSSLSGIDRSLELLTAAGLAADVVAQREIPFGPISIERLAYLRENGYAEPDATSERICVIRAVAD